MKEKLTNESIEQLWHMFNSLSISLDYSVKAFEEQLSTLKKTQDIIKKFTDNLKKYEV